MNKNHKKATKVLSDQNSKDLVKVEEMERAFQQCQNLDQIWIWSI